MSEAKEKSRISAEVLRGVSETLLMPLWSRAVESARPDAILRDPKGKGIVEALDYDFGRFARLGVDPVGYCSRAAIIDRLVSQWLEMHPAGAVVEIGVGLDTRFERLDNGKAIWFELDLPEVIALRRHFFAEEPRRRLLPGSVFEPAWMEQVRGECPGPVLLVAEGVFYFFEEKRLRELFRLLVKNFPGGGLIFDCQSPWFLWYSRLRHPVRGSELRWSLSRVKNLEGWDPGIRVRRWIGFGDSPYYDGHFRRFPAVFRWIRKVWPPARGAFKIVEVSFLEVGNVKRDTK
jgi:O-methyltransferase involved in polyketide biosynthesis